MNNIKKLESIHEAQLEKLFKDLHTAPQRGGYNSILGRKMDGAFDIKKKITNCIKVMNELRQVSNGEELSEDSELEL